MLVDTDELRAFETVAARRSFSMASADLGCSQSTISQRIARLEKRVNRKLIRRTTRRVSLTADGEAMLIYARAILSINEDARQSLVRPSMQGTLKLGVEDEFATTRLPRVLGLFREQFPEFGLRLITGRNEHLYDTLRAHEVDVVLGKSHGSHSNGEVLWQEELVWMAGPVTISPSEPLPLISYLNPSITRGVAEAALMSAHRDWVTIAESSNLLGLIAGAQAGFGIIATGRSFLVPGLREIADEAGLPALGSLHYVIEGRSSGGDPSVNAFIAALKGMARQVSAGAAYSLPFDIAE